MREHLLRPSLTDTPATAGLYSLHWMILPAFFLGPVPLILYSAVNSRRLKRGRDAIVCLLSLAATVALMHALLLKPVPELIAQFAQITGSNNTFRDLSRLFAVMLWGVLYFMHRAQYRSTTMMGNAPSPWIVGIICCVVGAVLTYGMAVAVVYVQLQAGMA